jgi:hypothetical protein
LVCTLGPAPAAWPARIVDCGFEPEEAKDGHFLHPGGEWTETDWAGNLWSSYGGSGVELRSELPNGYDASADFAILNTVGDTLEVDCSAGGRGVGSVSCMYAPLSTVNDCRFRLEYNAGDGWEPVAETRCTWEPGGLNPPYAEQRATLNLAGKIKLRWVLSELAHGGVCLDSIVVTSFPERAGEPERKKPRIRSGLPWKVNNPVVDIKKEIYLTYPAKGQAPLVSTYYIGPGLERLEIQGIEVRDDVPHANRYRVSSDNGRTWSDFTPLPNIPRLCAGVEVLEYRMPPPQYDPVSGVLLGFLLRQIHAQGLWNNYTYACLSRDQGKTWTQEQQLTYEPGAAFDPAAPLNPDFLLHNQGYPGNSILFHSNGTRLLILAHANTPDDPQNDTRMWKNGSVCMIGAWDPQAGDYHWQAGGRVSISPTQSGRGLMEPEAAELADGRVLVVWRGSNTAWDGSHEVTEPGRKWYSLSADGGRTFSAVSAWGYDDGSLFYSPSSYHRLLRHSVNRRLYWLGNICAMPPNGNEPRYPLVLGEVDDRTGLLKKETVTAIDDRKPDQGAGLQFSNFSFWEDRETHRLEIYLTAYGEYPGEDWRTANVYRYTLTPR